MPLCVLESREIKTQLRFPPYLPLKIPDVPDPDSTREESEGGSFLIKEKHRLKRPPPPASLYAHPVRPRLS